MSQLDLLKVSRRLNLVNEYGELTLNNIHLQIILEIVYEKRHVFPQRPLGGASVRTASLSTQHLLGPAMM